VEEAEVKRGQLKRERVKLNGKGSDQKLFNYR